MARENESSPININEVRLEEKLNPLRKFLEKNSKNADYELKPGDFKIDVDLDDEEVRLSCKFLGSKESLHQYVEDFIDKNLDASDKDLDIRVENQIEDNVVNFEKRSVESTIKDKVEKLNLDSRLSRKVEIDEVEFQKSEISIALSLSEGERENDNIPGDLEVSTLNESDIIDILKNQLKRNAGLKQDLDIYFSN